MKKKSVVTSKDKKDWLTFAKNMENVKVKEADFSKNNENLNKSSKYLIFAGIGNPINFLNLLNDNGINVVNKIFYPDHYNYTEKDIAKNAKLTKIIIIIKFK